MATISTTGPGESQPNNNGGTTLGGGNVDTNGIITNNLELKDVNADDSLSHGSRVVPITAGNLDTDDVKGVQSATGGGTFAYFPNPRTDPHNVIVKGAGTANAGKINNLDSDLLNSTGSEFGDVPRGKPNQVSGSTALGNPKWEYPTMGIPDSGRVPGLTRGATEGSGYTYVAPTGDGTVAGADKNVDRGLAVPGEVTYRTGAPAPVTTNLKPRNFA